MSQCGKRTRSGGTCKNSGMTNGRCRMHGGTSKGAPKGNKFASKHNIYSPFMSPDERALAETFELDSLEGELRLSKIQLMRALEAQSKSDSNDVTDESNLVEYVENELQPASTAAKSAKTYKKRDFHNEIDKLKARIESLTLKIDQLSQSKLDKQLKQLEIDKRVREANDTPPENIEITVSRAKKDGA